MEVGKGKKGGKKKAVNPFAKKDWYDIKACSLFQVNNVGKTLVTRTQGTKVHGDYSEDVGTKVERPAKEAVVEETLEIVGA